MPYIDQTSRKKLMAGSCPQNAGEIQYLIAWYIKAYIEDKGMSYQTLNDVMGALSGAQMEFYRRKVIPYENSKITENGDV